MLGRSPGRFGRCTAPNRSGGRTWSTPSGRRAPTPRRPEPPVSSARLDRIRRPARRRAGTTPHRRAAAVGETGRAAPRSHGRGRPGRTNPARRKRIARQIEAGLLLVEDDRLDQPGTTTPVFGRPCDPGPALVGLETLPVDRRLEPRPPLLRETTRRQSPKVTMAGRGSQPGVMRSSQLLASARKAASCSESLGSTRVRVEPVVAGWASETAYPEVAGYRFEVEPGGALRRLLGGRRIGEHHPPRHGVRFEAQFGAGGDPHGEVAAHRLDRKPGADELRETRTFPLAVLISVVPSAWSTTTSPEAVCSQPLARRPTRSSPEADEERSSPPTASTLTSPDADFTSLHRR